MLLPTPRDSEQDILEKEQNRWKASAAYTPGLCVFQVLIRIKNLKRVAIYKIHRQSFPLTMY